MEGYTNHCLPGNNITKEYSTSIWPRNKHVYQKPTTPEVILSSISKLIK